MSAISLLELIRAVGKKPGFYIAGLPSGSVSILHLRSFLVGHQCGRGQPAEGDDILDSMTYWVCTRLPTARWIGPEFFGDSAVRMRRLHSGFSSSCLRTMSETGSSLVQTALRPATWR